MNELSKVNVNGAEYTLKDETARQNSGGNGNRYRIKGKTVVYFGDSICFGAGSTGGYASQIQQITGCISNNLGRSGATIANAGTSTYKIVNLVREFSGDADMIVIEGGTNDYNQGVALGEITATYADELDETTFCGALESIIQTLLTNYPTAQLFGVFTHRDISDTISNSNGVTKKAFHDKAVAIYEKYAMPYYDAYADSGLITAYSTASGTPAFFKKLATLYTNNGDGLHPNEAGYAKYYVPQIIDILERHCPIGEDAPDTGGDTGGTPTTIHADMNITGFTRANGTFSTAENGRRTDYISMNGVQSITVKVGGYTSGTPIAFYDASKVFIANISPAYTNSAGTGYYGWYEVTVDVTSEVYSGASYFVVSSYHSSVADGQYDGDNTFGYDSVSYVKLAEQEA